MAMATMAAALVKSGLVTEDKVAKAQEEMRNAETQFYTLSQEISSIIRTKKSLRNLQEMVRQQADHVLNELKHYIEDVKLLEINISNPANQKLLIDKLNTKLNKLEDTLRPLIQKSRKLEQKFGFSHKR
jgi:chromosome segregation ATPase